MRVYSGCMSKPFPGPAGPFSDRTLAPPVGLLPCAPPSRMNQPKTLQLAGCEAGSYTGGPANWRFRRQGRPLAPTFLSPSNRACKSVVIHYRPHCMRTGGPAEKVGVLLALPARQPILDRGVVCHACERRNTAPYQRRISNIASSDAGRNECLPERGSAL